MVDHLTSKPTGETRNVLREAARIARGKIRDLAKVKATELDALIIPGGFGAARNLCNFADAGPQCEVHPEVARLLGEMLRRASRSGPSASRPRAAGRVAGSRGIKARVTIGNDAGTAAAIEKTGCVHEKHRDGHRRDEAHKIVTTPAYMRGRGRPRFTPGSASWWSGCWR